MRCFIILFSFQYLTGFIFDTKSDAYVCELLTGLEETSFSSEFRINHHDLSPLKVTSRPKRHTRGSLNSTKPINSQADGQLHAKDNQLDTESKQLGSENHKKQDRELEDLPSSNKDPTPVKLFLDENSMEKVENVEVFVPVEADGDDDEPKLVHLSFSEFDTHVRGQNQRSDIPVEDIKPLELRLRPSQSSSLPDDEFDYPGPATEIVEVVAHIKKFGTEFTASLTYNLPPLIRVSIQIFWINAY